MNTVQHLMMIVDGAQGGGYSYGRVKYPEQFKNQDANAVLATLGQQGWEVTHMEAKQSNTEVVFLLKKHA